MKTLDDLPRKAPLSLRLEAAAMGGDLSEAISALAEGASPGARGREGWRPLHLACGAREEPRFGKFLSRTGSFRIPLDSSARAELVELLIGRGGGIDAKDGRGATAAHWSAKWGLLGCLKALREAGANMAARDNSGRTPLMWAAARKDAYAQGDVLDGLIEWGCILDEKDLSGMSAVHHACRDPGAMASLARAGASLDARSLLGRTALHEACLANRASTVAVLLAAGADALAGDSKGRGAHEFGGGKAAKLAFAAREAAMLGLATKGAAPAPKPSRRM